MLNICHTINGINTIVNITFIKNIVFMNKAMPIPIIQNSGKRNATIPINTLNFFGKLIIIKSSFYL